ncbi:MAG: DUF922 domain-containing protein, partial [Hyphomicrobiaceae bacterium]
MRTIWPRQLFVACVTLLLTPAATSADTRYEEKIEYYDLGRDITSTGAIWQAIRHRGPGRKVGGNRRNSSVVGTARSQIKRNYRFAKGRNGLCSLTELNIDLKVTITLPKWRWQHDKPRKLKDYFQCVLNTVTKHENRHAAIWRETVEEMTDTVNRRMTNV